MCVGRTGIGRLHRTKANERSWEPEDLEFNLVLLLGGHVVDEGFCEGLGKVWGNLILEIFSSKKNLYFLFSLHTLHFSGFAPSFSRAFCFLQICSPKCLMIFFLETILCIVQGH